MVSYRMICQQTPWRLCNNCDFTRSAGDNNVANKQHL